MGRYAKVICKCYAILHKEREHPQIVDRGVREPMLHGCSGTVVFCKENKIHLQLSLLSFHAPLTIGTLQVFQISVFVFIHPSIWNIICSFLHFTNAQTSIKNQVLCHYLLREDKSFHLFQVTVTLHCHESVFTQPMFICDLIFSQDVNSNLEIVPYSLLCLKQLVKISFNIYCCFFECHLIFLILESSCHSDSNIVCVCV